MRVVYADAGLSSEIGHHANSCRLIAGALRSRGHAVAVAAFAGVQPELAESLDARPHFRLNTYWGSDGDPVCGWLNAFFASANATAEDLARLGPWHDADLLYVNSVMPAQLMAIRGFLLGLPEGERPHVVAELGTGPGLDWSDTPSGPRLVARDPRIDSRATLYRFAGLQIVASALPRLHICSFDRTSSDIYATLLGIEVTTLPVPHIAGAAPRLRTRDEAVTIGVLGHQRGEKGYHLVPAIAAELLRLRPGIRLLVHNAQPDFMRDTQAELRRLAAADGRVVLDERAAGPPLWQELLDRSDLILCPYMPEQFRAAYSAIASEAIANAVPLVVPAATTLARVVAEFGAPGVAFEEHSVAAVVAATVQALDRFDELAARAVEAARRWGATMGADRMVDAMLALTAGADMPAYPSRRPAAQGDPPRGPDRARPGARREELVP